MSYGPSKLNAYESPARNQIMDARVAALEFWIPVQRLLSLWRFGTVRGICFKASAELAVHSIQLLGQWPFGSARMATL